jgi:hypothetical protein
VSCWFARAAGDPIRRLLADQPIAQSDGSTVVPWRKPLFILIVAFPLFSAYGVLWRTSTHGVLPAELSAFIAIAPSRRTWSRATIRHRALVVACVVALVGLTGVAVLILPPPYRYKWYLDYPASLTFAAIVVCVFVLLSRRPGYGPPAMNQAEPFIPPRLWTRDERAARLGMWGQMTIRRPYPILLSILTFVFLTLISLATTLVGLVLEAWAVAVIAALVSVLCGYLTIRAGRIEMVADADGITVRNLLRTHWVLWTDISGIVPASADNLRCLRIQRSIGRAIRCRAVVASVFQRAHRLDHFADDLTDLLGPPESAAIPSPSLPAPQQ